MYGIECKVVCRYMYITDELHTRSKFSTRSNICLNNIEREREREREGGGGRKGGREGGRERERKREKERKMDMLHETIVCM